MMKRRRINIMGISETKWKGSGSREVGQGYWIWWSGGENGRRNGVAVVMDKKMTSRVMEMDVVSERIIKATVRVEGKIMDIIQVYAPQTGCTDDEKREFEEDLERHVKEERTIIIGDFNTQVSKFR
ncbi:craniofacial development protein 2-like [Homalodisca vitripennis]|uniref:craniofacial development protein 2-like n=1 Tax=Homalodisca vitripennis TaxID=197043 RepID=UPI001EE9DE3D|nr:craniofacial development protein 2-like [Homalodisca vitripennis]